MEILLYNNTTSTPAPPILECRGVHQFNASDQCNFVRNASDCRSLIGYVDYVNFMFCSFDGTTTSVVLGVLWLFTLFIGLGVTANNFLCPALFVISKTLRMSQNVAGVTLLAFGNGSPDIFSAIAGIKQGKNELVVGGLIGGGIFVTTMVAGSVFLVSDTFTLMKRPFLRDILFYLGAASWAYYLFYSGAIYIYHSIGFISLYVIYIIVVVVSRIVRQKQIEKAKRDCAARDNSQKKTPEKLKEPNNVTATTTETITFSKGISDFDDPESYGVVLKAFFFLSDEFLGTPASHSRTPKQSLAGRTPRQSVVSARHSTAGMKRHSTASRPSLTRRPSGFINQAFVVPVGDNICITADNTVINVETPTKAPNKPLEELIREEEEDEDYPPMSECMEFLHLLSPVNFQSWEFMPLWEKILEVVKSPVLLLLTLTTPVVDLTHPKQYWCRPLNTMHLVTGPIFISIVIAGPDSMIAGTVPTLAVVGLCGLALALASFLTSDNDTAPPYHLAFAYLGFLVSVVWIYCIANEIVVLLQAIGVVYNLSDTIIGLTILAWGNCLLDFLSNIAVARKGFPRMGVAACFGSPFLTLLLGVGIPTCLELVGHAKDAIMLNYTNLTTVLFTTLAVSLISTLSTMSFFRFRVRKMYGGYLVLLYVVFLVTAILIESNVV